MFKTKKKLHSVVTALVVLGATQLAQAAPAHAEDVCVPIDTQTDLGPGLLLCVVPENDQNPDDPQVGAYLLSYGQTVASTHWTLGETDTGKPTVRGVGTVGSELVRFTFEFRPEHRLGTYVRVCVSVGGGDPVCVLPEL